MPTHRLASQNILLVGDRRPRTHTGESLRLSPRDTFTYHLDGGAGAVKITLGSDEEAVTCLQRAVEANPNYPASHFWLASALAHLGRLDGARFAVQAGLALDPTFTVSRYRKGASSSNPVYLAQRERIYDGMRKAGVPEGEWSAGRSFGCQLLSTLCRSQASGPFYGYKTKVAIAARYSWAIN